MIRRFGNWFEVHIFHQQWEERKDIEPIHHYNGIREDNAETSLTIVLSRNE